MGIFDKIVKKVQTKNYEYCLLTLDEIHEIINPIVMSHLRIKNFDSPSRVLWAKIPDTTIRPLYSFAQWQAGMFAPRWGVSLDFVPHLVGKNIKFHKTFKSARFDLLLDCDNKSFNMYYIKGKDYIIDHSPEIIKTSLEEAEEFWSKYNTIEKLPNAIEYIKNKGLWFNDSSLTNAFIYARIGEKFLAEEELLKFGSKSKLDNEKLAELLKMIREIKA